MSYILSSICQSIVVSRFLNFFSHEMNKKIRYNPDFKIPENYKVEEFVDLGFSRNEVRSRLNRYLECSSQLASVASFTVVLMSLKYANAPLITVSSEFLGIVYLSLVTVSCGLFYAGFIADRKIYNKYFFPALPFQKSREPADRKRINLPSTILMLVYIFVILKPFFAFSLGEVS